MKLMLKQFGSFTIFYLLLNFVNSERVFNFQNDNKPSNESRATIFLSPTENGLSELQSLSVSFWFNVHYFRETSYVVSYATSDERSNELNLCVKPTKIGLYLAGIVSKIKRSEVYILPNEWYHLALSVNLTENSFVIYLNSEIKVRGRVSSVPTILNGSLILGQETDAYNGGFVAQQSFSGKLSGFNLYGRALTSQEVKAIYECDDYRSPGEGDIVSWKKATWDLKGSINVEENEICKRKISPYKVITQQLEFLESRHACERLFKTDVYQPPTEAINDQLYEDSKDFINICQPSNHGYSYFWLGATDKTENGVWRGLDEELLIFTNFRSSSDASSQECAAFDILPYYGAWNDVRCKGLAFCFACKNPLPATFLQLRGLCDQDRTSTMFKVGDMSPNGERNIQGYSRYEIYFNEGNRTWHLFDMWNEAALAELFDLDHHFPVGMKSWTLLANYDVCGLPRGTQKMLTLSACNSEEFTCKDGSCIDLAKRCDLVADCKDSSDENDCKKLSIPMDYMEGLPPSGSNGGPLDVNVSIVIEKLSEIDVRNMKLRVDFTIQMVWNDPRLTYRNLNIMDDINIIDALGLWTPEADYTNADFSSTFETVPSLIVHRSSRPMRDDTSRYMRDEHFPGHSNPLVLSRRVSSHFDCLMNLQYYPFDTQRCSITLRLKSARSILAKWGTLDVSYIGEAQLSEYEIGQVSAGVTEENEYSIGIVALILKRQYSYHITSVYLPTFMLLLISCVSLFCKLEDNDLRIMMVITTLLVLYSLYQQISDGLPNTSYAKAVDIWCFFALTVMFSQVVYHVFLESIISIFIKSGSTNKLEPETDDTTVEKKKTKILYVFRFLYFLFVFAFTFCYFLFIGINR